MVEGMMIPTAAAAPPAQNMIQHPAAELGGDGGGSRCNWISAVSPQLAAENNWPHHAAMMTAPPSFNPHCIPNYVNLLQSLHSTTQCSASNSNFPAAGDNMMSGSKQQQHLLQLIQTSHLQQLANLDVRVATMVGLRSCSSDSAAPPAASAPAENGRPPPPLPSSSLPLYRPIIENTSHSRNGSSGNHVAVAADESTPNCYSNSHGGSGKSNCCETSEAAASCDCDVSQRNGIGDLFVSCLQHKDSSGSLESAGVQGVWPSLLTITSAPRRGTSGASPMAEVSLYNAGVDYDVREQQQVGLRQSTAAQFTNAELSLQVARSIVEEAAAAGSGVIGRGPRRQQRNTTTTMMGNGDLEEEELGSATMPSSGSGSCRRQEMEPMQDLLSLYINGGDGYASVGHNDVAAASWAIPSPLGLNLGGRVYFAAEYEVVEKDGRLMKRRRPLLEQAAAGMAFPMLPPPPFCQADGCTHDLSFAKHYHRRHKVCEYHSKSATVFIGNKKQRFCQQCSRFHALAEFDDGKRSCRRRLEDHNRRRRKHQATTSSSAAGGGESAPVDGQREEGGEGDGET